MTDMRGEEGAGSVLSLAVIGSIVCVLGLLLPVAGLFVVHDQAQTLSDQAALNAADALNGITWGEPCAIARSNVGEIRASQWTCQIAESDVYVSGEVTFGPLTFEVKSRAGAPDN